jgi:hypothetical protein
LQLVAVVNPDASALAKNDPVMLSENDPGGRFAGPQAKVDFLARPGADK